MVAPFFSWCTHLSSAEVEAVGVGQEICLVVEFGHQLLDIAAALQAVGPGGGHIVEQPVCVVESVSLQLSSAFAAAASNSWPPSHFQMNGCDAMICTLHSVT